VVTYLGGGIIEGSSSTGATDTLGTAVNGSNSGANNSSETAIHGQTSIDFDGSNDRIDIDALGGVARTTGSFCFWLNPDTGGGYPLQISDANGNEYIKITSESTFVSTVQRDPAGANWEDNPGGTVAPHDKWTHIVLTQNGTTVKWYLDAVDQGTFTDNNDVNEWINADMDKFTIGAGWHYSRSQFEDFYNGQIQDVGFWNRALTSAEVTVLFNGFDKDSATSSSNTGKKVTDISQTGLLAHYTFNDVTTGITNSATVTDEKVAITNIPVGTRYHETDTRQVFRYKDASTIEYIDSNGHGTVATDNNGETLSLIKDAGVTFGDFTFRATLSITEPSGNYNGTVGMWVSDVNTAFYPSSAPSPSNHVGAGRHRHNNATSDSFHGDGSNDRPYSAIWDTTGATAGMLVGSNKNYELSRVGSTIYWKIYNNGFGSSATSTESWTWATTPLRYFELGGRWNGSITATNSYAYASWGVDAQWKARGTA